MIADTSFLFDLMRQHKSALNKLSEIERESRRQFLTSPSVFELAVGVAMSDLPLIKSNFITLLVLQLIAIDKKFKTFRLISLLYSF